MPHPSDTDHRAAVGDEWRWLDSVPPADDPTPPTPLRLDTAAAPEPPRSRRLPSPRVWIAAGAAVTVAAVLVLIGALTVADPGRHTAIPTATAAPPTRAAAAATGPCTGLSGTTITDRDATTETVTGVVARFEYAYYRLRDASAALAVVAAEAGLVPGALAEGIGSIPAGSVYCVAITPLGEATANVHVVEQHPDHTRVDYLQTINARSGEHGLLITNIQKQAGP
ncbi:hypothetical protein [Nocardia nova]|uniref:hypothetical protein n=1 Tax=Nocardia nova TaxID=37330 RepID=UPI00340E682F